MGVKNHLCKDLNLLKFNVKEELSGIRDENNIKVFLDGEELIVEYNSYKKIVFYKIKTPLEIGPHQIKIEVVDNAKNISSIERV